MSRLLVNIDKVLLALFTGGALAFVILAYQDRLPGVGSRPYRGPWKDQSWHDGEWDESVTTHTHPGGKPAFGPTKRKGHEADASPPEARP